MRRLPPLVALIAIVALAGCGTANPVTSPAPATPTPSGVVGPVQPAGDPLEITRGLVTPW